MIFPSDPEGQADTILFKAHTANRYLFNINSINNTYTPYPGLNATLIKNSGSPTTYTLKDNAQRTYFFDSTGQLQTYTDAQGHGWIYEYYPDGKLERISAEGGKYLYLEYDPAGQLIKVSDHHGRFVSYHYNSNGDLDSYSDVLAQNWTYEYHPTLSHFLTRVAAPDNVTVEEQEFDPANGRVLKQYDGEGNQVVELTYPTITSPELLYSFDFETGDLSGWSVVSGDAFNASDVTNLPAAQGGTGEQFYQHETYHLWGIKDGGNGQLGVLRSDTLNLPASPLVQFLLSGGNDISNLYVALVRATDNVELFKATGNNTETYQPVRWDASAYAGQAVYLKVVDTSTSSWGHVNIDHVEIYNSPSSYSTTAEDALGNITTHSYDPRGTLVDSVNAAGSLKKHYDANFRPDLITDPLLNETQLAWSANGANLSRIIDPLQNTTEIDYGVLNNPISILDPLQRPTTYAYGNSNFPKLPTRITYPLLFPGETTNIYTDYDYYPPSDEIFAGKLMQVTDPLLQKTYYEYEQTGTGHKEIVHTAYQTENEQITIYEYDDLGRLIEVTDPANVITRNEYDATGRLAKTTRNVHPTVATQNYQDRYNLATEYRYDLRGNQIAVIDTYGTITRTYYDLDNRPVTVVQNLVGQTIETTTPPAAGTGVSGDNIRNDTLYDDVGNLIAAVDPAGVITRTYYDSANRPVTVVQNLTGQAIAVSTPPTFNSSYPEQNIRTDTVYDANGNVIASIGTLGIIRRTYYDVLNRPATVVQHLTGQAISVDTPPTRGSSSNLRTDMYYDANGNVIATKDPREIWSRTYYDSLNRPIAVVQNLVGKSYTDPTLPDPDQECGSEANICSFTYYDKAGNAIATVDPRGVVTRTYYDSANRPKATVQNWDGADIYDNNTIPARGSGAPDENMRTDIVYDSFGRRDATTDPLGHVTKYQYSETGQLVQVTNNYMNGGLPQNDQNQRNIVTAYEYDALGRTVKTTDTLGRIALTTFDDLSRVLTTTQNYLPGQSQNYKDIATGDQYNLKTTFTYDVRGSQIAVTDTKGVVTRTYYDALGRSVTVIRNLTGSITNSNPPERGNPIDPLANLRTDTFYLGNGSLDYVLDEMGETTDYDYDALGRLTSVRDPLSNLTNYEYDAYGNRTRMIDAQGIATNYEYDNLSRLKAVVENYQTGVAANVETNVRTEYTYDAAGNRLTIRDGKSFLEGRDYRTLFTYDDLGRLKTETDPLSHTTTYDYLADYVLKKNRVVLTDANNKVTTSFYDELGRLQQIDYPSPDADVTFTYDALGRRTDMTDGSGGTGHTQWSYNNLDLPEVITDPFGTGISYDYDALGNRTALSYGGQSYTYQYNSLNQLSEVAGSGLPSQVEYGYDAAGRLKTVTRPNGVNTTYNYFDNGWLMDTTHSSGMTALASYQYQYYPDGNRSQVIENVQNPQLALNPSANFVLGSSPIIPQSSGPLVVADTNSAYEQVSYKKPSLETHFDLDEQEPTQTPTVPDVTPTPSSTPEANPLPEDGLTPEASLTPEPTISPTPVITATPVPQETEEPEQAGSTFSVNSIGDGSDQDTNDGICQDGTGVCTLRAALEQADAQLGRDTILFGLPGSGPFVIQPWAALPVIVDSVVIDGTSQPGYSDSPIIVLDGIQAGDGSNGLYLKTEGSLVSGLLIQHFDSAGIRLEGKGGNQITGNTLSANRMGILLDESADNQVGGPTDEERNLISGNGIGIYLHGDGATGNEVLGNLIGDDAGTETSAGNDIGIRIQEATGNQVGGEHQEESNEIEGNADDLFQSDVQPSENEIQPDVLENEPGAEPGPASENETAPQINSRHEDGSEAFSVHMHFASFDSRPPAAAKTFTVNSNGNGADLDTTDGLCKTSTNVCSLKAAIQQANTTAAQDTINFNIPGAGPTYSISPGSALPTITEPVVIDGTTQPGFAGTPIVRLNGANAGLGVNGLTITAGLSVVTGLVIDNFDNAGVSLATASIGRNWIYGNYIGTNFAGSAALSNGWVGIYVNKIPNNVIGGITSAHRNVISGNGSDGVYIFGAAATGNVVEGNYIGTNAAGNAAIPNNGGVQIYKAPGNTVGGTQTGTGNVISGNSQWGVLIREAGTNNNIVQGNYIGTDASGTVALGNVNYGVFVDVAGTNNLIGGTTSEARNVISGNGDGIVINFGSGSTVVQGNYIGTDLTGMLDLGNTSYGIEIPGSPNNTVGGTIAGAGNLISGNNIDGVRLTYTGATGNIIQGNKIGTNINGEPTLGNTQAGVLIAEGSNNTIGGINPAARNLIAGNNLEGIVISQSSATRNAIQNNLIWSNGGIGIDLRPNGVTPDDSGDADSGPNNLQNFPVLTTITGGASTKVVGTLNSAANTTYRLEFFSNTVCDSYGYGEGETYLGFTNVTTDGNGNTSFNVTLAASTTIGQFVSATATDPSGNTSEFSACKLSTLPAPPTGSITINYVYDPLNRLTEANYSNNDYYHYTYDAVGNRETQSKSNLGFVTNDTYAYDDANRLTSINGVTYTWDNNGNLLNDGTNTYTYDSANRLKTMSNPSTVTSYQYNGMNDRLRETVNGSTTTFTMDLNAGLTQALNDGTNAYIYGNGRIAQVGTGTEYFLGDALGSVRQMTNASGAITYAKAYDPYGVVTSTAGSSQSAYAFTGEYYGDYNKLLYLRARHYTPSTGRFLTRDTWPGNIYSPMSYDKWNYVEGNPIMRIDPSGKYSKEMISKNMNIMEFSAKPGDWKNHSHWAFYALLRKAEDNEIFELGHVDLLREYPDVNWNTFTWFWSINCETIMVGHQSLREFYYDKVIRQQTPGIVWRDTSSMYYKLHTGYYNYVVADGNNEGGFPHFKSISIGPVFLEINIITDVDGNRYLAYSGPPFAAGYMLGVGYTESYMCGWFSPCTADISQSDIESAVAGICAGVEGEILGGINLGILCHGYSADWNFSSITTFYAGLEAGAGGGLTITLPLSMFGVPANPSNGWRWALIDQMNGITFNDVSRLGD